MENSKETNKQILNRKGENAWIVSKARKTACITKIVFKKRQLQDLEMASCRECMKLLERNANESDIRECFDHSLSTIKTIIDEIFALEELVSQIDEESKRKWAKSNRKIVHTEANAHRFSGSFWELVDIKRSGRLTYLKGKSS